MASKDSVIYNPGLIRDDTPAGCGNGSIMRTQTAPDDKSNMIVTTSHPGTWTRPITVYVPAGYVRGVEMPFIVLGDGGSTAYKDLCGIFDSLIAQRRIPPLVAIQIGDGGQDAQGSQRGKEYDAVNGIYTQFVEREVLPLVEKNAAVKLTKDPDGRATLGLSSSGAALSPWRGTIPSSFSGSWPIRPGTSIRYGAGAELHALDDRQASVAIDQVDQASVVDVDVVAADALGS